MTGFLRMTGFLGRWRWQGKAVRGRGFLRPPSSVLRLLSASGVARGGGTLYHLRKVAGGAGGMADSRTKNIGLRAIPVADTKICYINGQEGILSYRGYRIETLAAHSTFEEVSYLLLYGDL